MSPQLTKAPASRPVGPIAAPQSPQVELIKPTDWNLKETRFSSTPRTLAPAKSKRPTSKPHACANSQPSLAAWPEIWTAASRKECDNAISENVKAQDLS